jgi:3-isopropylmalate/(R)-2-methylmalate dehydratase small subunit
MPRGILHGMVFYGTTHSVGNNITTAQIIAPEHADDPSLLAAHCLEFVDSMLAERVAEGDVLLAGSHFGAGDAPDTAVLALQALGFSSVVAVSFAPGFVEAAEAYGLPALVAPDAAALPAGHLLRLDLERGTITDRATGSVTSFTPCSPTMIAAVRRAQLLRRMRQVVEEEGFDG